MTELWIIDAFASEPFTGNPAAVCLLEHFPEDTMLQRIAMEMNLSETAFLMAQSSLEYRLRWFTPTTEVNLCGHATLAATHMLLQSGQIEPGATVTYNTLSGRLSARALENSIELDFPELAGVASIPHPALAALGVDIVACERNRDNYLVEVKDYQTLLSCSPDFHRLRQIDMQGVIVTTASGVRGFDFASRYFGPNCGVNEDPVTGSAHCFLAPYWSKKLGKNRFQALQASKRTGTLDVTLENGRVLLGGQAVTALKGKLQVPVHEFEEQAA